MQRSWYRDCALCSIHAPFFYAYIHIPWSSCLNIRPSIALFSKFCAICWRPNGFQLVKGPTVGAAPVSNLPLAMSQPCFLGTCIEEQKPCFNISLVDPSTLGNTSLGRSCRSTFVIRPYPKSNLHLQQGAPRGIFPGMSSSCWVSSNADPAKRECTRDAARVPN